MISSFGSVASHLAMHDLLLVAAAHRGGVHVQRVGLDLEASGPRAGGAVLRTAREQARGRQAAADHAGDVAGDGLLDDQALLAAVLGDEAPCRP